MSTDQPINERDDARKISDNVSRDAGVTGKSTMKRRTFLMGSTYYLTRNHRVSGYYKFSFLADKLN